MTYVKDDFKVDLLPDDSEEIITMYDENDEEIPFYQIACVEHKDEFYAILQPAVELEGINEDEVVILKMVEQEGEEEDIFMSIDDEELADKIFEAYVEAVEKEIAENEKEDN